MLLVEEKGFIEAVIFFFLQQTIAIMIVTVAFDRLMYFMFGVRNRVRVFHTNNIIYTIIFVCTVSYRNSLLRTKFDPRVIYYFNYLFNLLTYSCKTIEFRKRLHYSQQMVLIFRPLSFELNTRTHAHAYSDSDISR